MKSLEKPRLHNIQRPCWAPVHKRKSIAMSTTQPACLINQDACGRKAGNPVCPKCGIDDRVVYPGQGDLEVVLVSAELKYWKTHAKELERIKAEEAKRQTERERQEMAQRHKAEEAKRKAELENLEIDRRSADEARRKAENALREEVAKQAESKEIENLRAPQEKHNQSGDGGSRDVIRDNDCQFSIEITSVGNGYPGGNGKPTGDLYIVISLKKHDIFERSGDDIHCSVPIDFVTAALGGEIKVPTLDGIALIDIPKGTQPDKQFRLRGKGIKGVRASQPGDLYLHIQVEIPIQFSEQQHKLLKELGESLELGSGKHSPLVDGWRKKLDYHYR